MILRNGGKTANNNHSNNHSQNLRKRETKVPTSQVAGRKLSNIFSFCFLMERKSERCVLAFEKKVGKRSRQKEGQEEIADRFSREKDDQEARDEAEAENAENSLF